MKLTGHAQDCWALSVPALSLSVEEDSGETDELSTAVWLMLAAAAAQLFLTVSLWRNGVECLEHDSAASRHSREHLSEPLDANLHLQYTASLSVSEETLC